jgi:hypothetical protein
MRSTMVEALKIFVFKEKVLQMTLIIIILLVLLLGGGGGYYGHSRWGYGGGAGGWIGHDPVDSSHRLFTGSFPLACGPGARPRGFYRDATDGILGRAAYLGLRCSFVCNFSGTLRRCVSSLVRSLFHRVGARLVSLLCSFASFFGTSNGGIFRVLTGSF